MTTPDDPTPSTRLRARARVGNPRLRAEVAEAVTGVERSLVDVATWERLQALEDATPRFTDAEGEGSDDHDPDGHDADDHGAPDADPDADTDADADDADTGAIPLLAGLELPPPPPGAREEPVTAGVPLLSRFQDERPPVDDIDAALDGVRTVPATTTQAEEEAEEAERRRRKGKILSWSGVALLLVVAAIWLIPDRDKDGAEDLPAQDRSTTSTTDSQLLLPDETTTTTTVLDTTTTQVTAPASTTPTTARRGGSTTNTTRPPTTTTTAPAPTTTAPSDTLPPLQNPGPTRPVPSSPPATPPSTTTTTTTSLPLP